MTVVKIPKGDAEKPALFLAIQRNGSGSTRHLFGVEIFKTHSIFPRDRVKLGELSEYFVFGIVRNPWERMHSMWRWVTRFEKYQHIGFREWCFDFRYKPQKVDSPRNRGRGINQTPQTEWLCDHDGNPITDHVYRFEQGLPVIWGDLVRRGYRRRDPWLYETPKLHRLPPCEWREDYTPELVERVAELFAPDIWAFDYEF